MKFISQLKAMGGCFSCSILSTFSLPGKQLSSVWNNRYSHSIPNFLGSQCYLKCHDLLASSTIYDRDASFSRGSQLFSEQEWSQGGGEQHWGKAQKLCLTHLFISTAMPAIYWHSVNVCWMNRTRKLGVLIHNTSKGATSVKVKVVVALWLLNKR